MDEAERLVQTATMDPPVAPAFAAFNRLGDVREQA
jgi:hypothetical protein